MGPSIKQVPVYFGGSLWLSSGSCYCKFSIDLHLLLPNMPASVMLPDKDCHLLCIQLHLFQPGILPPLLNTGFPQTEPSVLFLFLGFSTQPGGITLCNLAQNWQRQLVSQGCRVPLCDSSGRPFALLLPIQFCSSFHWFLTTQPFFLPSPKHNSTYDKTIVSSHTVHLVVIT